MRLLNLVVFVLIAFATAALSAQSFDESFDLWPVDLKINGIVVAGGGGKMPTPAIDRFNRTARKPDTQSVVVHFENASQWDQDQIKKTFESANSLSTFSIGASDKTISDKLITAIDNAQALWIAADKSVSVQQHDALIRVLELGKKLVARGGVVCVNGPASDWAGKLNHQQDVDNQSSIESLSLRPGVNLIPDAVVAANYDDKNRSQLLSALAAHPRQVAIGVPKNTAIVLQGRKIRVIGPGQATFCLMANEEQPIRVQHVKQATSRRANPYQTIVDLTAWRRDAIERTVKPFPEPTPPIPHVKNGSLIIVGGGGMPRGLMQQMVERAGGKNAKMVYVPCSPADEVLDRHGIVETWKRMGVASATYIHTKDRNRANTDESFLEPLKDATGIWFGGGRQWNFSDSYYGTTAHKLMKQVLDRGGVIGGSSAGASIQARYLCRANPVANFDIMAPGYERGLGFISGVAIDQHFSQRGRQKDMTQLVDRYPQLLGIGLDEATAIVVEKSIATVIGRNQVFFYDRRKPVVPGQDDFIALSAGSKFDLEKREIVDPEPPAASSTDDGKTSSDSSR